MLRLIKWFPYRLKRVTQWITLDREPQCGDYVMTNDGQVMKCLDVKKGKLRIEQENFYRWPVERGMPGIWISRHKHQPVPVMKRHVWRLVKR